MTPQELESIRLVLGDSGEPLTQARFARLLWVSERQLIRYLRGQAEIPPDTAFIARVLAKARAEQPRRADVEELRAELGT